MSGCPGVPLCDLSFGGLSLTDEAFLGELDGEPPGDFLQLGVLKTHTTNSVQLKFFVRPKTVFFTFLLQT